MLDFVHFTELYLFFLSFSFHGIIFRCIRHTSLNISGYSF